MAGESEPPMDRAPEKVTGITTGAATEQAPASSTMWTPPLYRPPDLRTPELCPEESQSVETLVASLMSDVLRIRTERRMRTAKRLLFIALLAIIFVATSGRVINLWYFFQIGGGAWAADKVAQGRRGTAAALRKAGDPRAIGPLALAARDGDPAMREVARDALFALLPAVRENDAAHISSEQMSALLIIGQRTRREASRITLLKSLEQIGDSRALPFIHQCLSSPHAAVAEQAASTLEFVQLRIQRLRESETLLRAAGSSVSTPAREMLRAAAPQTSSTPHGLLLHAAQDAPENE